MIAEVTSGDLLALVGGLFSSAVAIVVVVMGNKNAMRIAIASIRAEVIAKQRQAWLDRVRELLCQFLARADELATANDACHDHEDSLLVRTTHSLSLYWNLEDPLHQAVNGNVVCLALMLREWPGRPSGLADFLKLSNAVIVSSQRLFKQTWEEVKAETRLAP